MTFAAMLAPSCCCQGRAATARAAVQRRVYVRPGTHLFRRRVYLQEDEPVLQQPAPIPIPVDPYAVATARLSQILTDTSFAEEGLLEEVESYGADAKLTLCTNFGTAISILAFIMCWLCGEDPLGGMSLTSASLDAGLVGGLCAVPLMLCSVFGHSQLAKEEFPVLEELHRSQRELLMPWISGLNFAQMSILVTFLVVPYLMLLLPAMKGGLITVAGFAEDVVLAPCLSLLQPWADLLHVQPGGLPPMFSLVAPAVISSYIAGFAVASSLSVKRSQISAIRDALQSADRYFRLTLAMSAGKASTSSSEEGSKSVAEAFKNVAVVWMMTRRQVAQLGCILTSLNVAYFGLIWMYTNDMTTPMVAAMLHAGIEFYFVVAEQEAAKKKGRRVAVLKKAKGQQ